MALALHNNALLALAAAVLWGGGDFSGGMAVKASGGRTSHALRVIVAAHSISLAILLPLLWATHAPKPSGSLILWGVTAGIAAAVSVTAFYIALSHGSMGASAALSGLLAASIPAVVSSVTEGEPSALRLIGFATAGVAIWLIASAPAGSSAVQPTHRWTMPLAIAAGIGFGIYFVALKMDNPLGALEPIVLARTASLSVAILFLVTLQLSGCSERSVADRPKAPARKTYFFLQPSAFIWVIGVALLDTLGNIMFVAATRRGRLDVASVLSSLYPASTILLAIWMLHEHPTRRQIAGMATAFAAVLLITL